MHENERGAQQDLLIFLPYFAQYDVTILLFIIYYSSKRSILHTSFFETGYAFVTSSKLEVVSLTLNDSLKEKSIQCLIYLIWDYLLLELNSHVRTPTVSRKSLGKHKGRKNREIEEMPLLFVPWNTQLFITIMKQKMLCIL